MRCDEFPWVEIGSRLKSLRQRALLTLREAADRTRVSPNHAWRLEAGRIQEPGLGLLTRYLRACGARWSELFDLLERVDVPALDLGPIQESNLSDKEKQRLSRAVTRQSAKFWRKLPYPGAGKPVHPARVQVAGQRLRNYRVVAAVVEQQALEPVRQARVLAADYLYFRMATRQVVGVIWRALKSTRSHDELVAAWTAKGYGLPDRLTNKLRPKNATWERQGLDMALVTQVQNRAVAECQELWRRHPELFPGPKSREESFTKIRRR